ncbi:hypothetical protein PISMIDRAFT_49336, partial [Pisolithus microcarpus 441]
LELTESEWDNIRLLLLLLAQAEKAQQAFFTEQGPTMHTVLPALEALFKAWSSRKESTKYADFTDALEAGLSKIAEYYERMSTSNAHIIAMLLNPAQKLSYIRTYWGEELLAEVVQHAEVIIR